MGARAVWMWMRALEVCTGCVGRSALCTVSGEGLDWIVTRCVDVARERAGATPSVAAMVGVVMTCLPVCEGANDSVDMMLVL